MKSILGPKLDEIFLRFSLAASFLSAVADRFGLWGKAGDPGVVWGNFEAFQAYTAILNPWATAPLIPFLAWTATLLEIVLPIGFLTGIRLKETAWISAVLLAAFFLSMTITTGIKGPLDYSVFTASAASLFLHSRLRKRYS